MLLGNMNGILSTNFECNLSSVYASSIDKVKLIANKG